MERWQTFVPGSPLRGVHFFLAYVEMERFQVARTDETETLRLDVHQCRVVVTTCNVNVTGTVHLSWFSSVVVIYFCTKNNL